MKIIDTIRAYLFEPHLRALVGGAYLFFFLGTGNAIASSSFEDLDIAAIPIAKPSRALQISIANAGDRIVAVGEYGAIIYSDDDGKTWHQARVPVSVTLTTVAFATPKIGWAAGDLGVVLKTVDGGVTWTRQITGVQVNQLMLQSATQFAAANPGTDKSDRALHRANIFMQGGPDQPFLSILPIDAEKATVFGAYRMCVTTEDGGKSWSDCSLNIVDPISHNLYDVEPIGSSVYIVGELGNIYRSDDGGGTFNLVSSPAENTFFGILAGKANSIFALGVAGALFETSDMGNTWTQVSIPTQANLTAGIMLKSGIIVVASQAGALFASSDNGKSFHVVPTNLGMSPFDLVQAKNGDVIIAGSGGVRAISASVFN